MTRTKKTLFISAAIIVLLLIAGYVYLQFRKHDSFKVHIHKEASLLMKVNVDGLLFEMGYSNKQDKSNAPRGLAVPANVFVYNLHTKSPLTFFCSLPVKDTTELRNYLSKVMDVSFTGRNPEGELSGRSKDGRLTVLYNAKNIAFSYSVLKENVTVILNDILEGRNTLKNSDPKIQQLKNTTAHFSYSYEKYNGAGSIKDNLLVMTGSFPIAGLGVPDQSLENRNLISKPVLKIWLNADLKKYIQQKSLALKNFTLPLDSIAKHYNGYAALELGNYTTQENQEVTYEYNDDFEKVELLKTKKVNVPDVSILFKGKAVPLVHYLHKNDILQHNVLNKDLFPLYNVYTGNDESTLLFSTAKTARKSPSSLNTPYFFSADIAFNQIRKINQFPIMNSYISPFQYLKARAKKQDASTGQFDLELKLN